MPKLDIRNLYYLAHIDNLSSILIKGILSRGVLLQRIRSGENIQSTQIADSEIVGRRRLRQTPDGRSLWDYVNLFFQPRNSMLFRVIDERGARNITVLRISNTVLQRQGIFIADGIASNKLTRIYPQSEGLQVLQAQQEFLQARSWISWNRSEELERRLMAECLVPNRVDPKYIQQFIVDDHVVANSLRNHLSSANIQKLVVANDIGSNIFTPFN